MIVRRERMINVTPKGSEGKSWRTSPPPPPTVAANKASLDMGLLKIHTRAEEEAIYFLSNTHAHRCLLSPSSSNEQTFTRSGISVDIPVRGCVPVGIPRCTLARTSGTLCRQSSDILHASHLWSSVEVCRCCFIDLLCALLFSKMNMFQ